MKKISLLLAGMAMLQFAFGQRAAFGLKGGLNISNIHYSSGGNANSQTGFHAGGLVHVHLNRNWAVQPEVVFSKEGAQVNFSPSNVKVDLNYINVPVLIQYMSGPGFRVETGPQVGLLTAARLKYPDGSETRPNGYSAANLSWAFGLGYLTRSGFGVDGRFNLGLTNLFKEGYNGNVKGLGRVGQIGLFYQFR